MSNPAPVDRMDPPHMTEFASERYFSKLNQLSESSTRAQDEHQADRTPPQGVIPSQTTFILPLRSSKTDQTEVVRPPDYKRPEKSRLFGLRSILHSKPHHSPPEVPQDQPRISEAEHTRRKSIVPLDQLFLALPNELQIQIIASLPLADILRLRLASRSWHTLITLNEAPIVRFHLDRHIPAYALRLYPVSDPSTASFHHICGLWHRLHVAAKLSFLMCEWITKEIFLRATEAQRAEFAPQRERMRRRLIPLLFTVFHFFEMYRSLHIRHIREHDGHGLLHEPYTLNPIEVQIMNMYDDQTLLRVHQVFPLIVSSFCRQLRPPSYVGRVERGLRGYFRDKPPDEVHVAILCIGGLRQVEKFWEIKRYNRRRGEVDSWYAGLAREQVETVPAKPKRSLLGLGRKKSSFVLRDMGQAQAMEPNTLGSVFPHNIHPAPGIGLVFHTSLAAGMPMGPLAPDHARALLPDLPSLQQIWLTTAEALILDRKIVDRTQDIKRNAQVMLELIREEGMEEEDEWWYGRDSPDSVRPPLEALEEDVMDGVPDEVL